MHLMSFYSTPYAAKDRDEYMTRKLKKVRFTWLLLGLIGGAAISYFYHNMNLPMHVHAVDTIDEQLADSVFAADGMTAEDKLDVLMRNEEVDIEIDTSPDIDAAATANADEVWPKNITVAIASGDTLISVLLDYGVDNLTAQRLAKQINTVYNVRKMRPGHELSLTLEQDTRETLADDGVTQIFIDEEQDNAPSRITFLSLYINKLETVQATLNTVDGYDVAIVKKKLTTSNARAKAEIKNSLYNAVDAQGMPRAAIAQLIKNFSYDVDFQRDIRTGDKIDVMYQAKQTSDGDIVAAGDVLYASLETGGKRYTQYLYSNEFGLPSYYNEHGESIIKKLLKTPIDGARLSSGFGMRRHPILGYTKMHRGLDFAAPRGTPIFAAGDGVVEFAGRRGGYGNYVKIRHNGTYSTAYAHAHRIHASVKKGRVVEQGQIIAYVGSTGRSTGPHLHYEIHKNNKAVNPLTVKFTGGNVLIGKKLASFKTHVKKIHEQLVTLEASTAPQTVLAQHHMH